ncbi:MAG TPA: hypothetical protein VF761_16915 [Gemmatimonadaceae bacterium]
MTTTTDRFCGICHEPEFDANNLRHADVSSGHAFTPEGAMEIHHISVREIRVGDVLLDEDYHRMGTVLQLDLSENSLLARLDDDSIHDLSAGYGVVDVEVVVLRPGCEECDWRGFVFMNLADEPEGTPAHVERCDTCRFFETDDDAAAAARFTGFQVPT